ncbi:MAG: TatD family hydrolase [Alphaproteobacteria bacterium]
MVLIDSHTHLFHAKFGDDPARTPGQLVDDAVAAGVGEVINIACRREEWPSALALAETDPRVWVGAGVHPHDAAENPTEAELLALAAHPRVVALGETGLDYHYDTAPRAVQRTVFERHMAAAQQAGLPVIIHTREAEADTLDVLKLFPTIPFVLHCFTSSAAMAEAAVEMGGYISFSGVLTFKKSEELRLIASRLPRERVLVETDAPYLAPEPNRGRRCSPAMVAHTAACLAKVWGISDTETAQITAANTRRLFGRMNTA